MTRLHGEIDWRSGPRDRTTKIQGLQNYRSAFSTRRSSMDIADDQGSSPTAAMENTKSNSKVVKSPKTAC